MFKLEKPVTMVSPKGETVKVSVNKVEARKAAGYTVK
jgi:hypothetical protein